MRKHRGIPLALLREWVAIYRHTGTFSDATADLTWGDLQSYRSRWDEYCWRNELSHAQARGKTLTELVAQWKATQTNTTMVVPAPHKKVSFAPSSSNRYHILPVEEATNSGTSAVPSPPVVRLSETIGLIPLLRRLTCGQMTGSWAT